MLVARMKNSAASRAVFPGVPVTFSSSIDATKVEKVLVVSSFHKAIIGGSFTNHVFDISNLPKDSVNTVIAGTSASVKINKFADVKVAFMYSQ